MDRRVITRDKEMVLCIHQPLSPRDDDSVLVLATYIVRDCSGQIEGSVEKWVLGIYCTDNCSFSFFFSRSLGVVFRGGDGAEFRFGQSLTLLSIPSSPAFSNFNIVTTKHTRSKAKIIMTQALLRLPRKKSSFAPSLPIILAIGAVLLSISVEATSIEGHPDKILFRNEVWHPESYNRSERMLVSEPSSRSNH